MNTKTFSKVYNHKLRTVQWYLKNNWQELEKRDIIFVRNKNGKRLKYEITNAIELDRFMIKI